jgi:hypothetical protein
VHYMERTSAFRIGLASGARLYDMDVICLNFSLVVKAISITFYPSFFLLSLSLSLSPGSSLALPSMFRYLSYWARSSCPMRGTPLHSLLNYYFLI